MGRFVDLTGKRFHWLLVLHKAAIQPNSQIRWTCKCDCGATLNIVGQSLRTGHTKSCGCWNVDVHTKRLTTHGSAVGRGTTEYRIWCHMKSRCNTETDKNYPDYGGRGIKVCARWNEFENFLSDMGSRPKGLTLDREDNSKGYSKENCKWATRKEQMNNTRRNNRVEYRGTVYSMSQLADHVKVPYHAVRMWVQRGWDIETALSNYKPNLLLRKHNKQTREVLP